MCLIADIASILALTETIFKAALGLGGVIFVHELGHFLVAKACGVQCDKFFIGFDIGGYKLSRKWGETEYGIGILPLGGYVKMLGQDDNPAHIAEQMERSQVDASASQGKEVVGPAGEKYTVNPRSYLAKSVPQRMAIISAGVIMNIIFAFLFALIAFGMGVPYTPCIVSRTVSGSAAWEAGLRSGDEIVQIGDRVDPNFTQLTGSVMLGDLENGVPFEIRSGSEGETRSVTLKPRQQNGKGLAKIGILGPRSLRLLADKPTASGSAAEGLGFQGGDEIVRVGDEPVSNEGELTAQLALHREEPLAFTVRRGGEADPKNRFAPRTGGEEITITIPPAPMRRLGLAMRMGAVMGVQENSPAAEAGIRAGDTIVAIEDGMETASIDPLTLSDRLRQRAKSQQSVRLSIERDATDSEEAREPLVFDVTPRVVDWLEASFLPGTPLSASALGIAYPALNEVATVTPGSPAEQAGLRAGDKLLAAKLLMPPKEEEETGTEEEIKLGDTQNWPMLMSVLQRLPIETQVELTYERDGKKETAKLKPEIPTGSSLYLAERGFHFEPLQRIRVAESFGEQVEFSLAKTTESLGMVFRFLQKIGGQVPITALGGPVTIARVAGQSANEGIPKLLIFLTMLSANLAVINFLPIPMLDGGHMVFLAWEGITGRPANEKFVVALHTIGFVLLISLMLFVIGLDFGWIPRNL